MKTLDDLEKVVREALADWDQEFTCETEAFRDAMNPQLLAVMIAELKESREAIDSEYDGDAYHEARSATDKILEGNI